MKNQKSLTIITGIVTLISMVSYLASGRGSDAAKIVSDLSLAIFGSALLGFIMSLSSYYSAKQQELHDFISAVERYIDQFYWIHPLQIQIPMRLYQDYLFDKDDDASDALYNELIRSKMLRPETKRGLTVAGLIHEWVKQTVYDSYTEEDIEEEVNNRLDQAKDQIEWSMNMYKSLPNIDVTELMDKCDSLAFFKKKNKTVTDDIIKNLRQITVALNSTALVLKRQSPKENIYYRLNRLLETEKKIFEVTEIKPYEYEDAQGMFTYQVITKRNLFVKKIFNDINTLSGMQYEGNPYTWEVSIISPLLQ